MNGQRTTKRASSRLMNPLLIAAVAGLAAPAMAQPQGAQVVHGSASFNQNGSVTTITAADKTIINYNSFNIGAGSTVRFVQPGSHSKVLNRIRGGDPTTIAGSLISNGIVYIVNPAGVIFSRGATLNVGGIYAAAGKLSNADFVNGNNHFTNLTGSVENHGTIHADAAGLFGASVANYGSIVAPNGMVAMAAGDDVMVGEATPGGGNFYARVSGTAPHPGGTGVTNAGTIDAAGGHVMLGAGDLYAVAIDHSGTTRARDIHIEGGQGGIVKVAGTLDASNSGGAGGTVKVLGDKVGLFGASVNASGSTGGGEILIGGNEHGEGAERTATATFVSSDSTVRADATQRGDGGRIIVWSDLVTRAFGQMSAKGGASGGDGGFVETSSKSELQIAGTPNVTAAHGKGGTWLIDPEDLDITNSPTTAVSSSGPTDTIFTSTGPGAELFVGDLEAALTGGANVQVVTGSTGSATGGILTLQSGVTLDFNGTGTNTLTLSAHRKIVIDGQILDSTPGGDQLNLSLIADSDHNASGNIEINNTVETGGGSFTATGVDFTLSSTGSIATAGGAVNIGGSGTIRLGAGIDAGGGSISFDRPVILTSNVTLAGHDIDFTSTVDSDSTARDLTVNSSGSGDTTFGGVVGRISPLGAVTTNTDGRTILSAASLSGATVHFGDPVALGADATVIGSTSVTFDGTITSLNSGTLQGLTVDSPLKTFNADIGVAGGTRLASLQTNAAGTTTLNGSNVFADQVDLRDNVILGQSQTVTGQFVTFEKTVNSEAAEHNSLIVNATNTTFSGDIGDTQTLALLRTDAAGTTTLGGSVVKASTVDFRDAIVLNASETITATTEADFGAITSQATEENDLIVNSPSTLFGGRIGGGSGDLGHLTTDSAGITFLRFGGSGNTIEATNVNFGDVVVLSQNATIKGTTTITFGSTVDSGPGGARDLSLDSPAVTFSGLIGGTHPLHTLTSLADSTVTLQTPTVTAEAIDLRGRTVLGLDTTLVGTTSVSLGAVDSESGETNDLTINSPLTTLTGAVGQRAGGGLGTLSTDAAGTTALSGANVNALVVNFTDAVQVAGDSTIAGTTSVTFGSTIDNAVGDPHSLTVNSPITLFSGTIGLTHEIGTLKTDSNGTTTIAGGTVKGGVIDFEDSVLLNQATTVAGSTSVRFGGTLDSSNAALADLDVNSPTTTFVGAVGSGTGGSLGIVNTDAAGTTIIGSTFKASSVHFADTVTLNGAITTSTTQVYDGNVLLAGDIVLAGTDITFNNAVDSTTANNSSANHSLTVNSTGNGTTRFNGPVGVNLALSTLGTNIDGKTILAGGPVHTTGAQAYDDAVILANTTTLNATNVTFGGTLDSDGVARSLTVNSLSTGVTTFDGAVGSTSMLQSITTNSDGTTKISGGTVQTHGAQVYNDNVVLGGDTILTGTNITFGGKLDSDTSSRVLAVNTVNNGTTTFVGAVGSGASLTRITTNADGKTRILATSITTSGAQNFNDAVAIGAVTVLTGKNVTFNSTVDADTASGSSSLTVNTTTNGVTAFNGRVGGIIPVKGITTNADGKTRIGADMTTAGNLTLNDAVVVYHDVTLADTGGVGVSFGSTLDSDGTPRALTFLPNPDSQATPTAPTISRIGFTGTVGGISPFSSITIGGDRSTNPAAATVVAGIGSDGTPISNYSLIIDTTGDFTMARFQKFSVLGNLTINSGGPATIGDISTLGNLSVNAPSIAVISRPGGEELFAKGTSLVLDRDGGVDFVAGGSINFSQTPSVVGGFLGPAFATPDAANIGSNLLTFPQRAFGPLTTANLLSGTTTILDLAAIGPSSTNLATAIPGPEPTVGLVEMIPPTAGLTSAQIAVITSAGIDPRLIDTRHIPPAAARQFAAAYDALFYRDTVNADGQPIHESQAAHIRSVLEGAWKQYAAAAKDKADPLGFRAFVEAVPEQAEARFDLNAIRDVFDRIGELGLTPAEAAGVRRSISEKLAFPGMTAEQLETSVMATQLGAAPASGPALAAR